MGVLSLGFFFLFVPPTECHASPSFQALYTKAVNGALSAGEREAAFSDAARLCPGNATLYADYSSFLVAQGDFRAAFEVSSHGLRRLPGNPTLMLNQGIALYSMRRTADSLAVLSKLKSPEAFYYQALNYVRLAEHSEARRCLRTAWDMGYRDPHLLYLLIEEDHALGDKPAGLADFQTMLRQYSNSAWLHMVLGNAAFSIEKDSEARSEYEQALALSARLPNANFRLGYLAYQAGEDELAARYFRNELAVDARHSDAALFLGETLKRLGRTSEAIPYLKDAVALDPASGQAYGTLATALTETQHLQEAVDVLQRAEERFPRNPAFPAQLARLFARLDRKEEAEKESERLRVLTAIKRRKEEVAVKQ